MAESTQTLPGRIEPRQRRRLWFIGLLILELLVLAYLGTRLVQVETVVDRTEVTGNFETVYYRNEIIGDPPLLVLLVLGVLLPLASRRLRREALLLVVVQAAVGSLIVFVIWPLAEVFVEGFRAGQLAEGFSLIQFERLLSTPTVVRASINTLTIGTITGLVATTVGTLIAYTLTLTDVPGKRLLRILTVLPLVSPPFAVSFAIILLLAGEG